MGNIYIQTLLSVYDTYTMLYMSYTMVYVEYGVVCGDPVLSCGRGCCWETKHQQSVRQIERMRRTFVALSRNAKGRGWYKQFMEEGAESFAKNVPPTPFDWSAGNVKRPRVYFDMKIEDEVLGRIEFELANDIVPKTVENFIALSTGSGKFGYKGCKVHDIVKSATLRTGDVEKNNGTMSHSSFSSRYFEDENFIIPHSHRGLLSMVSNGVHSNGSQFYITLAPAKHLNGRGVAFGRVVKGDDVIASIEKVGYHDIVVASYPPSPPLLTVLPVRFAIGLHF